MSSSTTYITMQTEIHGPAARTRRFTLLGTLGLGLALVFSLSLIHI